jgi:hypothetical protein
VTVIPNNIHNFAEMPVVLTDGTLIVSFVDGFYPSERVDRDSSFERRRAPGSSDRQMEGTPFQCRCSRATPVVHRPDLGFPLWRQIRAPARFATGCASLVARKAAARSWSTIQPTAVSGGARRLRFIPPTAMRWSKNASRVSRSIVMVSWPSRGSTAGPSLVTAVNSMCSSQRRPMG